VIATAIVAGLDLHAGSSVAVVGVIPAGLPRLAAPSFDLSLWAELGPSSLAIALVSFVESVAIAKVLAAKRRERVVPNQELIGLGLANIAGAFTGASPVCGGFARSAVNFQGGARTQMAAIVTAILVGLSTAFLTPLFHHLPQAVLAAIIVVSVIGLFEPHLFIKNFRYSKADGIAQAVTFLAVLGLGIEYGILTGIALSLLFHLWRTSRPHIAIVGRVGTTEHFRNVLRHTVTTHPGLLLLRVDESLYFPNIKFIEDRVLAEIAERPGLKHFVLICASVNVIDASALETLEELRVTLGEHGVGLHLAEVKGPVMDKLERIGFVDRLGRDHIHLSTHDAVRRLAG
jgi:SulP family sulfate permease